jgi:iron complex outermembrane receptor protein
MKLIKTAGFTALALFCCTEFLILPVQAATALEEVVVTARKRSESFEDVPVSVDAFSAADIEAAGIEKPSDFIALTPNVTLVQTQNEGNSFINVRGVSQARNSDMSVAVLVDGVLMTNPAQFNQELFDATHIEVLRGPQGALYGRNAIGGAIVINTKEPTDQYEGKIKVGYDSGPGYKVQGLLTGPIPGSDTLRFSAAGSYKDTDGYIKNTFLNQKADPYRDYSGRVKLLWEPTDNFKADLRGYISKVKTHALYFTISANANDILPVRVNNPGTNNRDLYSGSLKMDYDTGYGTLTSITAYDVTKELLTGDQFNFVPRPESFANFVADNPGFFDAGTAFFFTFLKTWNGGNTIDLSQTQYLDVKAWSQEIRFTSPSEERLRWIAGAYFLGTKRFISTGNQLDRGLGVFNVYRTPRPNVFAIPPMSNPSPSTGLLEDSQDNFAWALFGELDFDISDQLEASFSLRFDNDHRENTTKTVQDPTGLGLVPGTVRKKTWNDLQPKITLTYKLYDNLTLYTGYSRGFRSGGFNQSGVGAAVPEPGVNDLYGQQTADTYEIGMKGQFFDRRLKVSASGYRTHFTNAYFFFFDPGTSTQNLGTIPEVDYTGFELETQALVTDNFQVYGGLGYTDSKILQAADPADNGNQAPLVSEYTVNAGGQYTQPVGSFGGFIGDVNLVARADYQIIGKTYWDPGNISTRRPVNLLNVRAGFVSPDNWSLMFWSSNALDEKYNSEFSPGPAPGQHFLFRAQPMVWGVDFTKKF